MNGTKTGGGMRGIGLLLTATLVAAACSSGAGGKDVDVSTRTHDIRETGSDAPGADRIVEVDHVADLGTDVTDSFHVDGDQVTDVAIDTADLTWIDMEHVSDEATDVGDLALVDVASPPELCGEDWDLGDLPAEPKVHAGDFVISTQEDVDYLKDITGITGDLMISTMQVECISLPLLENVIGALRIDSDKSLISLSLPALKKVQALVLINNKKLVALTLPSLTSITTGIPMDFGEGCSPQTWEGDFLRGLLVAENKALTSLALPEVETIGGRVTIVRSPALESVSMPQAEYIGGAFVVRCNPLLESLETTSVQTVGMQLFVFDNPELLSFEMPFLVEASQDAEDWSTAMICGNTNLASVIFTSLVEDPLGIKIGDEDASDYCGQNPSLTAVDLSSLESADIVSIQGNVSVDSVDLSSLRYAGRLRLSNASELETLSLPELIGVCPSGAFQPFDPDSCDLDSNAGGTASGDCDIRDNGKLAHLYMPKLEYARRMDIKGNPSLETLSLPNFREGAFTIHGNALLELDLPVFEHGRAADWIWVAESSLKTLSLDATKHLDGGLWLLYCESLETVKLPVLESASILVFEDCGLLSCLYMPELDFLEKASACASPLLPKCMIQELMDQCSNTPVWSELCYSGLADEGPCSCNP